MQYYLLETLFNTKFAAKALKKVLQSINIIS